ncbi:MAG: HemK/PrmC family methyltransferase [Verrucomicrobiota bacterium]
MKLQELFSETYDFLLTNQVNSPQLQAESILVHVLSCSRGDQVDSDTELVITEEEKKRVQMLAASRVELTPMEYFRKPLNFAGIQVRCSPKASIPRPDTEVLVDLTVRHLKNEPTGRIYDVGTGVGAIALALAKQLDDWEIVGMDITMGCLMVAHLNTEQFLPEAKDRIRWELYNLLDEVEKEAECVVANLPYVCSENLECDEGEISADPKEGLDGGEDGLDLIRKVIPQAASLSPRLFLEVGPLQAESVAELMTQAGYERVEVFKDFQSRERFVFGFQ